MRVKLLDGRVLDVDDNDTPALDYYRREGALIGDEPIDVPAGDFDPSEHKVDDVNEYLAGADPAEVQRVLLVEESGQARKGILGDWSSTA